MTTEKAIEILSDVGDINRCCAEDAEALDMAIKALEQEDVLDKIRAEIEQLTSRYSISKERGGMGQVEWSDRLIKESDVLQTIDKYKAETKIEQGLNFGDQDTMIPAT